MWYEGFLKLIIKESIGGKNYRGRLRLKILNIQHQHII